MRKFIKICVVTALIMVLVGLVLGIAGFAAGGSYEVVKMVRNGELTFDSTDFEWASFDFDGSALYDIDDINIFSKEKEILQGDINKKQIAEEFLPQMEITLGGGTLEILPSEDGGIYLEAQNAEKLQAYAEGNTLKVKAIRTKAGRDEMKVYLYIPMDVAYEKITLDVGAGVLSLEDLTEVGVLKADVGAGLLKLSDLQCNELKAGVGAGELRVMQTTVNGDADLSVGAGRIQAEAKICGDFSVECSMGEADILLAGEEEDFNYEVSCSAGSVDLGSKSFQGLASERELENGADKKMELNCALGAINISFEE